MNTFIKHPVSAAALLITLAACGGQDNGSVDGSATSPKDASASTAPETAQAMPDTSNTSTQQPDARQFLAGRITSSNLRRITPNVAPISNQGVRGDVILAALTQTEQMGSSTSPLQLPVLVTSTTDAVFTKEDHTTPLIYYSALERGDHAGIDTEFARTSHGRPSGKSNTSGSIKTLKYGFSFRTRVDQGNGDMVDIGKTMKLISGTDPSSKWAKPMELTADNPAPLNWKKTYNSETPLQTWQSTEDDTTHKALLVAHANKEDDKSFTLCERLESYSSTGNAALNPPTRWNACTEWHVPDNWKIPQQLHRGKVSVDENIVRLRLMEDGQFVAGGGHIHWSTETN